MAYRSGCKGTEVEAAVKVNRSHCNVIAKVTHCKHNLCVYAVVHVVYVVHGHL